MRESVNSASPSGLERNDDVSPEGISSSVVVTGSCISDTTLSTILSVSADITGQSLILGPSLISTSGCGFPTPLYTRFSYILLSKKYFGLPKLTSISIADVRYPLLAAVAAIERASISATEAICPSVTFEPSLLGKLRVECLIDSPLLGGTSPAPKHGPQNAERTVAPVAIISAITPFLTSSINTGWLDGYTLSENSSAPIYFPRSISAVSQIFSKPPPAQPAITPCST